MLAKRVSHNSFRPVLQRPLSTHARKERQADAVLYCVAAIGVVAVASYPSRAELEELGHPVPKRIVTQASEAIGSATRADESLLTRLSMSSYAVMYASSLRSTRVAMHQRPEAHNIIIGDPQIGGAILRRIHSISRYFGRQG
eukprot:19548-Heterococcus_DN1.PRE.2